MMNYTSNWEEADKLFQECGLTAKPLTIAYNGEQKQLDEAEQRLQADNWERHEHREGVRNYVKGVMMASFKLEAKEVWLFRYPVA